MRQECKHCHKKAENLKRCSACSIVWYCNSECQKSDWPIHLVDCNPGRPITTADRLVACIHRNFPPDDMETSLDFGFDRTPTAYDTAARISVYAMLILELKVRAKTINQWVEEGVLSERMQETFAARLSPERGLYGSYLWFINHQSTFGRDIVHQTDATMEWMENSHKKAWKYLGHNPSDSFDDIMSSVRDFAEDPKICFYFIALLFGGSRFGPGHPPHGWVHFGLCGCLTEMEEMGLAINYTTLLKEVSFDTFCQAYSSRSLPDLFAKHGKAIKNRFVLDVLAAKDPKSVWFLKDFVCADEETARETPAHPSIGVDYGFSNCQNIDEVIALRNAYKQVLIRTDADPLALHEACLRGDLFAHVNQLARLKPPQLFGRLMINPYPLVGPNGPLALWYNR